MLLPWGTFALFFLPLYTRMIRGQILETLDSQHVAAARAKGASELRVLRSHVLRPALLPLATMIGMDLGGALMAAIYIETIYGLGGFGSLMLSVVSGNGVQSGYDLPLVAALFFEGCSGKGCACSWPLFRRESAAQRTFTDEEPF